MSEPRYCTCEANGIELPARHAKDCRMSQPAPLATPVAPSGVDTYTPVLWATLNDDQKYEEYVRVRQLLAAKPEPIFTVKD